MKKILLLLAILIPTLANARQLTPQQALARVQNTRGHRAPSLKKLVLAYSPQQSDSTLLYVLNQSNGEGFYILSADDLAPALLAYSDEGTFDADNMPDNVRWWISQYETSIARAIETQTDMNKTVTHSTQSTDGYLIKSKWDQSYPYNQYCTDVNGLTRYTGCVATAMAQIMRYHGFPERGNGEHSYVFKDNDGSEYTISSDFSQHTYRWDLMLDNHFNGSTEQNDAVATLMKDCGVSVNMSYWSGGSGAATTRVAYALYTYFGYDKGVRNHFREFMTDQEWEDMLVSELLAGRPILYGATNCDGGHAFVCDGYDGNGYYHINWGWRGGLDGYYLMSGDDILNPYPTMGSDYSYKYGQLAVTGIQPDQGSTQAPPQQMKVTNGMTVTNSNLYRSGSYFYLSGNFYNLGPEDADVKLGVRLTDGQHVVYCESMQKCSLEVGAYTLSYYIYPSNVIYNGTYEVYPVFWDNRHPELGWQDMLIAPDVTIPTVTMNGTEPTMTLTSMPYMTTGGKHYDGNLVKIDDMTVHLEYEAVRDFTGSYLTPRFCLEGETASTGYFDMNFIAMSKGQRASIDLSLDEIYLLTGKSFEIGKTYTMTIYIGSSTKITPYEWNTFNFTVVDELPTVLQGDLNHDGEVNVTDVTMLVNMILTNSGNSDGDIDGSGQIDVADVTRLVDIILGK